MPGAAAKRLYITTFGCQMNEYDSARMAGVLAAEGYAQVAEPEDADVILINTCSVREHAAQKVRSLVGALRPLKETNPGLLIGVGGCLAQQEGKRLMQRAPHLDFVFGTGAIERLPEIVDQAALGRRPVVTPQPGRQGSLTPILPAKPDLRAMVTVMQGCDNFCSYCVVPFLRGRERSRPLAEIIDELARLAEGGAREVMLLGQNVNSYCDPEGGAGFAQLLEAAAGVPGLWRIRFTTSHPKDLSPQLLEAMAGLDKVMEQLHLPVQSGSDRILEAMGRGYTRADYLAKAQAYRRLMPRGSLGTDLIVGFPGETAEDFEQTMSLVEEVGYDYLFSFKYSDRPYTAARKLDGKLGEKEKGQRLNRLQARQRDITMAIHNGLKGSVQEVLVEGPAKKGAGMLAGRDRAGRAVNFPGPPEMIGGLARVEITEGLVNSLRGRLTREGKDQAK